MRPRVQPSLLKGKEASLWNLLLCHERGFKEEFKGQRASLGTWARTNQGKFICHRKSASFMEWANSNTQPYVLIIAWREAKPSIEAIMRYPPMGTFVLAEPGSSAQRAKSWAAENGFTILTSLDDVIDLLPEVVEPFMNSETAEEPAAMLPSRSLEDRDPILQDSAKVISLSLAVSEHEEEEEDEEAASEPSSLAFSAGKDIFTNAVHPTSQFFVNSSVAASEPHSLGCNAGKDALEKKLYPASDVPGTFNMASLEPPSLVYGEGKDVIEKVSYPTSDFFSIMNLIAACDSQELETVLRLSTPTVYED